MVSRVHYVHKASPAFVCRRDLYPLGTTKNPRGVAPPGYQPGGHTGVFVLTSPLWAKTLKKSRGSRVMTEQENLEAQTDKEDASRFDVWSNYEDRVAVFRPSEIEIDPDRPGARPLDMAHVDRLAQSIRVRGLDI